MTTQDRTIAVLEELERLDPLTAKIYKINLPKDGCLSPSKIAILEDYLRAIKK